MKTNSLVQSVFVLLILSLASLGAQESPPALPIIPVNPEQLGRYVIVVSSEHGPLRIDTITGRTWRLVAVQIDESDRLATAWIPCLEMSEVAAKNAKSKQ